MADEIVFHALPPSANSGVIRAFLNASGIPYKELNCWGQTRTPEFIAKFPNNCAPAIEHGSVTVSESIAIMRYLCKVFPDKAGKFYPEDPAAAAKIDMVCDYINGSLCPFFAPAVYAELGFGAYPGQVASMDSTKEHAAEATKEARDHVSKILEERYVGIFLANTKFLQSDTPTIADFRFAPLMSQLKCGIKLPERIEKYLTDCYAIEGFEEAMKPVDEFCKPRWVSE